MDDRQDGYPARLMCEGPKRCGYVMHRLSGSLPATFVASNGLEYSGREILYKCTKCGHKRRWGFQ